MDGDGTVSKTYDGTKEATVSLTIPSNQLVEANDDVAVTCTGTYEKTDVGENIQVTISDLSLSGADAEFYEVKPPENIIGSITPAKIDGTVEITGTPQFDQKLTAVYKGNAGESVTFQWKRGESIIDGAVGETYTAVKEDIEKNISVTVTGTGNYMGSVISEGIKIEKADKAAPDENAAKIDYKQEVVTDYFPKNNHVIEFSNTDDESAAAVDELTLTPEGEPYTVYMRYKETETHKASPWTEVTIPARPQINLAVGEATANSISVTTAKAPNGADVKYEIVKKGESADDIAEWQTSSTLNGLYSETEYTVYCSWSATTSSFSGIDSIDAITEKATYNASLSADTLTAGGEGITISFLKSDCSLGLGGKIAVTAPESVTLQNEEETKISSRVLLDGQEYDASHSIVNADGILDTSSDPVSLSEPVPEEGGSITEGTYEGTLEFTITYTETRRDDTILEHLPQKESVKVVYGAYSVTVGTAENGSASASSETAPEGKEITLSASPAEGYHLTGWEVIPDTVAVTDNTFTMPAENVTATPVFAEHTYVWTSNHNGTHNGTCSFSGCGAVLSDQSCDRNGEGGKCSKCGYIASPSVSYWPDVTAAQSVVENYSWTADQSAVTTEEELKAWIEAQLKEMNLNQAAYTVTITDFKEAVEGTAADRDGTDGSFHFTVKLSKGYASVTASVTEGRISAVPYTKWNVEIHAGEGGSVTGSGTFEEGSVVTVRAIPESDRYRFVHWEENGVVVSTSEEYTFTLTADCSLIAVFERIQTEGDITQEQPQITSVKGKLKDGWLHFQVVLSQETEGAEGYEYQSLDSSGKKVLRTKKAASSSCVLKKAPNNIYVRVRAWKTENGKKVYSQWSDPIRMYVKIKAGNMTLKTTSVNGRNVTLTFADNANFFKESDGYDCMLQKTTAGGKTYTRKNQKYRTIQFRNIKPGTYTAKARAYKMVNGKKVYGSRSNTVRVTVR